MSTYQPRMDPTFRIDVFKKRATELVAESGLPLFDYVMFDEDSCMLGFFWDHPRFLFAADLRRSNVLSATADDLLAAWHRKFGGDWRARLARGAIRREEPLNFIVRPDGLSVRPRPR